MADMLGSPFGAFRRNLHSESHVRVVQSMRTQLADESEKTILIDGIDFP
jgi:hypothetical protein